MSAAASDADRVRSSRLVTMLPSRSSDRSGVTCRITNNTHQPSYIADIPCMWFDQTIYAQRMQSKG